MFIFSKPWEFILIGQFRFNLTLSYVMLLKHFRNHSMSVQSMPEANEFSTSEHDFRLEESFTILLGEYTTVQWGRFCCFEKNVLTSVLSCYALCGLCAELQIEREAVGVIWVMFCLLILFFHHWQEPKRSQHTICDWSVAMCWTCANIRPDQEGRYGVITVILTGGKLRIA